MPHPKYPILFYKPATSTGGPFSSIPIAKAAQEADGLDYECELVVVIGKPCANVSVSEALSYVLGYAVGNDVSHREWQLKRGGTSPARTAGPASDLLQAGSGVLVRASMAGHLSALASSFQLLCPVAGTRI